MIKPLMKKRHQGIEADANTSPCYYNLFCPGGSKSKREGHTNCSTPSSPLLPPIKIFLPPPRPFPFFNRICSDEKIECMPFYCICLVISSLRRANKTLVPIPYVMCVLCLFTFNHEIMTLDYYT